MKQIVIVHKNYFLYEDAHETWTKSKHVFCPFCGSKNIWQTHRQLNYSLGLHYSCIECKRNFTFQIHNTEEDLFTIKTLQEKLHEYKSNTN